MKSSQQKVIGIVGPTGVGKTELGLKLSKIIPVEFISADSMQIYKGMDIITDKLPRDVQKSFPTHLVDVVAPTKVFNVADFCLKAKNAVEEILKNGKYPVLIGGTGLYVNSFLYGIFEGVTKDEDLRKRLEAESLRDGQEAFYRRLKDIDPEAALKINPHDKKRVVRALEVFELTKNKISSLQKKRHGLVDEYKVYLFGLRRSRQELYRRIDQRVDFMVNAGLLDEVRCLLKKKLSRTASMCIGIREMEEVLKGGTSLDEAVLLMKRNSRHFAKRQLTWFNKNKDIEWFDIEEGQDLSGFAKTIFKKVSSTS
jgi:tRNA dimethylallyltransferase